MILYSHNNEGIYKSIQYVNCVSFKDDITFYPVNMEINQMTMVLIQSIDDAWYIVPCLPEHDANFDGVGPFETKELAFIHLRLMAD